MLKSIDKECIDRRDFLEKTAKLALALGAGSLESLLNGCSLVRNGHRAAPPVDYSDIAEGKVQPQKGCYVGTMYFFYGKGTYKEFESVVGKAPKVALLHQWLAQGWHFPSSTVASVLTDNLIPVVTWDSSSLVIFYSLKGIAEGKANEDIRKFAKEAAKVNQPYFLRTFIEMTLPAQGHWPWAGQPQHFAKAWRQKWQVFEEEGANKNTTWVWNPYVADNFDLWMEDYYPGDKYVDWIAFNGYNFGSSQTHFKRWDTFDDLFQRAYKSTRKRHPQKPIMLGEFACNEEPGKARWIRDSYLAMENRYPEIRAEVWWDEDWTFHNIKSPMRGSIGSSKKSIEAFRETLKNPYFIGRH
jgi:hypothetical protein